MLPDVTIVIPTYNRTNFLQEAVASCFAGNESVSVQVVVVDDGSTDGTWDWLSSLSDSRVRAFRQENGGPQIARNRGLSEARGRYVKFLDDDDWLAEGALEKEVKALDDAGADLVAGNINIREQGELVRTSPAPSEPDPYVDLAAFETWTLTHRFTVDRALARTVGWDTTIDCQQDFDFWIRTSYRVDTYRVVNHSSGIWRQHEGRRTGTPEESGLVASRNLQILLDLARQCLADDVSVGRRHATQIGLWMQLHHRYLDEPAACREAWRLIERLGDGFTPKRPIAPLRWADRLFGPMTTERLLVPARTLKHVFT